MGRAPCCDKANVKRGPWSPEEDTTLKNYVETHGTGSNWIALPQKAGLKRCGKSCRLRWLNYLRPGIKHGGFTEEEDNVICSLYKNIGSRWSVIASHLPGRTDNDVKNYWNTKLKKKLLPPQSNLSSHSNNNNSNNSTHKTSTSPSPLTRAVPTIKSEQYGFGSFSVSAGNSPSSTLTAMDAAAGQGFNSQFSSHGHHASSFPAALPEPTNYGGGSSAINGGYVVSPTQDISAASTSSLTTENSNSYVALSDNVGSEMDAFLMDLGLGPMDLLGSGGLGLLDRIGDVGPIPVGMAATNLWSNCAASKPQEMYPSFTYS